jgi:hypothetical protein
VYFAVMIFVKIRTIGLFMAVGLFFANCGENSSQTSKLSNSTDSANLADTMNSADADLIGTDSGIVIVETQRKPTQLLGIWQQMPISALRESIKTHAQLIVNCIVDHKYQMDGGLTVLYKDFPGVGSVDVFVGIPVKGLKVGAKSKPLKEGFVLENIEGGSYLKATVNAEPGSTLKNWEAFIKLVKARNPEASESNKSLGVYPYFEYYQDSRNAEMTTTVSQAVLVMKKQ